MNKEKKIAWLYFGIFSTLIVLGILFKRVFGLRELLFPCHVVALFFLGGWFRRLFVTP